MLIYVFLFFYLTIQEKLKCKASQYKKFFFLLEFWIHKADRKFCEKKNWVLYYWSWATMNIVMEIFRQNCKFVLLSFYISRYEMKETNWRKTLCWSIFGFWWCKELLEKMIKDPSKNSTFRYLGVLQWLKITACKIC